MQTNQEKYREKMLHTVTHPKPSSVFIRAGPLFYFPRDTTHVSTFSYYMTNISYYYSYPRRIPGSNCMLISEIWQKLHVDGLPYQELAGIIAYQFPMLPPCITASCLNTFHAFDRVSTHYGQLHSSMITSTNVNELPNDNISNNYTESSLSKSTMAEIIDDFLAEPRKITSFINAIIRTVSKRDLMKLF
jgi:hypothetical protein